MAWSLLHRFKDGVGETASGTQVTEDFDQLKEKIEKLEAVIEALFNKSLVSITGTELFNTAWSTVQERALATPIEASASRPAMVTGMIVFSTAGQSLTVKVGGVVIGEYQSSSANPVFPMPAFTLKPGEKYELIGNPFQIRTSHKLL